MRLRLAINAAGDIRLQCLRDAKHTREIQAQPAPLLVCSSEFAELTTAENPNIRNGYGSISKATTFGKAARTAIREAGSIIDRAPRERCIFLTGTLPGSTPQAMAALAAWSAWIVRTVRQWVDDNAPGSSLFGVWEWQKRGALHIHLCVEAPTAALAARLRYRWKERWIKVLDSVSERSGVDLYAKSETETWAANKWITRTDAQQVEKSVSCYLSKYLSKGSVRRLGKCPAPPSRWWFCTRKLRRVVQVERKFSEVVSLPVATALDLFERVGGYLAGLGAKTFGYVSRFDVLQKGLVTLTRPIEASLRYDDLLAVLRVLQGSPSRENSTAPVTVAYAAQLFGGRVIKPA